MMGFLFYWFIAFVVFFFTYKLNIGKHKNYMNSHSYADNVDSKYFWFMVLVPIFWVVSLPALLIWWALERVTSKFFNN